MIKFIDVTEDMLITTGRKSKTHTNYLLLGYASCCTLKDECTCEDLPYRSRGSYVKKDGMYYLMYAEPRFYK